MPYEWITPKGPDAPQAELHLWPYRSLPRRGFVTFIGITATMILLPLLAVLGSPVLWGLLPFFLLAIAGIWYALQRNQRDGEILETLCIWSDRITLDHTSRRGHHTWSANPYWVRTKIDPHHDRIPNYITLTGSERTVELGAFLAEDERPALYDTLKKTLGDIITHNVPR